MLFIMNIPLHISDLDVSKIKFSKLFPGAHLYYSSASYDDNLVLFRTGSIQITHYGIPALSDFIISDNQRTYIQLPFDIEQPTCNILNTKFNEIDDTLSNTHQRIFENDSRYKKLRWLEYEPCIRERAEICTDYDSDDEYYYEQQRIRPRYCKIKIDPSDTQLFAGKDGSYRYIPVTTMTEFCQYINFRSVVDIVVQIENVWFKKNICMARSRMFGLSLFAVAIEVVPHIRVTSLRDLCRDYYMFIDKKDMNKGDKN